MKKIACFFAVAVCVACGYDVCDVAGGSQAGDSTGELSVMLECEKISSKATSDHLGTLDEENFIKRIDILVFDRSTGLLNASKAVSSLSDPCVFSITTGEKLIYAVANAPDLSKVQTVSQMEQVANNLSETDYRNGGLVMTGNCVCHVRLGEVAEPVIGMKRMVARVVVRKLKNSIASQYGTITVDCMFLANANKVQTIGGISSVPVNVDGYADASKTRPVGKNGIVGDCPEYMFRELGVVLEEGTSNTDMQYMYCHPTNAGAKTCIYLLLTIAGRQYYYRVPLLDGLQANKTYSVEIDFVNLGAVLPPDDDIQKGEIKAVVSVSGWDSGESYIVEF